MSELFLKDCCFCSEKWILESFNYRNEDEMQDSQTIKKKNLKRKGRNEKGRKEDRKERRKGTEKKIQTPTMDFLQRQ